MLRCRGIRCEYEPIEINMSLVLQVTHNCGFSNTLACQKRLISLALHYEFKNNLFYLARKVERITWQPEVVTLLFQSLENWVSVCIMKFYMF